MSWDLCDQRGTPDGVLVSLYVVPEATHEASRGPLTVSAQALRESETETEGVAGRNGGEKSFLSKESFISPPGKSIRFHKNKTGNE